jgi:hypothetical protein
VIFRARPSIEYSKIHDQELCATIHVPQTYATISYKDPSIVFEQRIHVDRYWILLYNRRKYLGYEPFKE